MHGILFSMYLISWAIGKQLPKGILWENTLIHSVGYTDLLLLLPVMVARYVTLALREERQMLAEFGEDYRTYMERTKRFLPFLI